MPGVTRGGAPSECLGILTLHDKRVATLLVGPSRAGWAGLGTWPGASPAASGQIAVDSVMADAHGLDMGDTVQVRGRPLRVVGLTGRTAAWMTPMIFVTRPANALEGRGDSAGFVLVRGAPPIATPLATRIARRFPDLNVMTREELRADDRELLSRSFNSPLLIMVLIALGVGALVIGLTTYGFVADRRREFGSLKAIDERNGPPLPPRRPGPGARDRRRGDWRPVSRCRSRPARPSTPSRPGFLFVALPTHYVILVAAALAMAMAELHWFGPGAGPPRPPGGVPRVTRAVPLARRNLLRQRPALPPERRRGGIGPAAGPLASKPTPTTRSSTR